MRMFGYGPPRPSDVTHSLFCVGEKHQTSATDCDQTRAAIDAAIEHTKAEANCAVTGSNVYWPRDEYCNVRRMQRPEEVQKLGPRCTLILAMVIGRNSVVTAVA